MGRKCPGCDKADNFGDRAQGSRYGCFACWDRLPQPLRQRYIKSVRSISFTQTDNPSAMRAEIDQWWAQNPAPTQVEPQVPLWKKHTQEKK